MRHGLTAGPAALNIFSATSFCRARGESETETAREASVRGDKPFERPARRIAADVAIVRQNGCCGFLVDGVVYRCNADTLHESKPSWQQLANRTSGQDFSRIHVLANAAITAASRIAGVSNMSHLMSF